MKKLTIIIIAAFTLMGCMSQEERTIRDYLNGKLTDRAVKADKVEIIGEDTVLSLVTMDILYNDCLINPDDRDKVTELNKYYFDALEIRYAVQMGQKKDPAILAKHEFDLRRLAKVKVTGEDGHVSDNIEIIFDVDNKTPYTVGNEYNIDLNMWEYKVRSVRGY